MEIVRTETRMAVKQHECLLCRQPILPGEYYEWAFCKDGSDLHTSRSHLGCARLCRDFPNDDQEWDDSDFLQALLDWPSREMLETALADWPDDTEKQRVLELWERAKYNGTLFPVDKGTE